MKQLRCSVLKHLVRPLLSGVNLSNLIFVGMCGEARGAVGVGGGPFPHLKNDKNSNSYFTKLL